MISYTEIIHYLHFPGCHTAGIFNYLFFQLIFQPE